MCRRFDSYLRRKSSVSERWTMAYFIDVRSVCRYIVSNAGSSLKKWGISAFDCNGDKNFTQVAMLKNSNKIKAKVVNMTPRAMAVAD